MTTYHQQLLYLADPDGNPTELVNGARLAYNLEAAALCGPGQFSNVLAYAGCEALAWEPVCVTNLLTANQSSAETDTTGFETDSNCAVTRQTTQAYDGVASFRLRSAAGGTMGARTLQGLSGVSVIPGYYYTITCRFRAAVSARTCRVQVRWYDISGTYISDDWTGSIVDTTTGWTEHSYSIAAPATARYAAVLPVVTSTGASNEDHFVDALGIIFTGTDNTIETWALGGGGSEATTVWQPVTFEATNPWDNSSIDAAEALGFYIEEWTGLDGAHHARSVTPVGALRGGAYFGPQSHKHRTMKINLLLLGTSERGLNYLFRWLEQQLLNCCTACGSQDLYLREKCPELTHYIASEFEDGWGRMRRVALLDGPTWEAAPAVDAGCYIRRVSFTLGAGDPCIYGTIAAGTTATSTAGFVGSQPAASEVACAGWAGTDRQVSATLVVPDYGSVAPKITITSPYESTTSGTPKHVPDLRIFGLAQYNGAPTCDPCQSPKVGELILSGYQAAGMEIVIDMAARSIRYRQQMSGEEWQDGSRYLARQMRAVKRWWSFVACNSGCVYVEPVYAGLYNSFAGVADDFVSTWTVEIESASRWGCC